MDPLTVSTLATAITALFSSAADEAGKSAWAKLSSTISARFGHTSTEAGTIAEVERTAGHDISTDLSTRATRAATLLLALAEHDPTIAALLDELARPASNTTVVNSVEGTTGPVVQAHTVNGGITFN